MANDTNKIKLLVLWDILCKNTDENHAMNSDEIREELAKRGISVMRKVVATDIAALNKYGYEVLSYKKKYYYYYVVSRPLETAEVVMLADVIKASKLTSTQKNIMIEKLSGTLCSHQAENLSKHIISLDKSRKGSSSLIYNVDAIERGIEENKQISFLYFDYDEKHKKVYRKNGDRYMVNPAFMVWNRDNYYMLCFSNGHDDMVDKAYQKFEECYTRDAKDLRRLRDAEAKLRKIQMKIENLTEMRVNGEITKQEFSSMKNKINGEMLMAEKEVEEAKTLLLEEDKMANPLIDKADFKDMIMEKLDFSTPIKQSNLVEAIVKKIVPNTTLDFTWYLNLFPRQEGNEDRDYREIKTFIIGYKAAKEFRKTRHTLLRENQWQDLMVRIMA